jgi:uncharacterized protein
MQDRAPSFRFRWRLLLGGAAIVTSWAVWQATDLQLDTDLQNMLPDTPAARAYRSFLEFGGVEKVFVLVTAVDGTQETPDLLVTAGERLATALRDAESIGHVRSGLDSTDEALFIEQILPRSILFADDRQRSAMLERLEPEAVRARVRSSRTKLTSPSGLWEKPLLAGDPLGLSDELDWSAVGGEALRFVDPASGAFLAADGRAALVIVTPRATEMDAAAGRRLEADLERAYAATRAALDRPVAFHALGGPLYAVQDERTIRTDLTHTVTTSAVGVAILLFAYFWSFRTPAIIALAVASGIVWTAALMSLLWGRLSVVGLAFASILLGLGVDYGIHGAVRFNQWRADGADAESAVRRSIADTAPAIRASVLTTMAAFLVLCAARFTPLRELGVAVALGLLMALAASLAIGAALLALSPVGSGRPPKLSFLARFLDSSIRRLTSALGGHDGRTVVLAALVTVAALLGIGRLCTEADLRSFRPADHPAERAEMLLAREFGVGADTMTILVQGPDLDAALERSQRVSSLLRQQLGTGAVVSSPSDWLLPEDRVRQSVRAWAGAPLGDAVATLRDAVPAAGMSLVPFERSIELLEQVAAGRMPAAVPPTAWPTWLSETIRVGPDAVSAAVLVRATGGVLGPAAALELARKVQAAEPSAAVASALLVGEELRRTVLSDLGRLGIWCGLAIAAGVFLSFRGRTLVSLQALLPVTLGLVWVLGLFGWLGVPLDPFSAMMAPLVLGIGVDDGLHALHGERAHGDLRQAILAVGPAIVLTTLTTCVGFGSLLVSSLPTLRRGGALVALGTFFCLLATLVVLPAVGRLSRRAA